MENTVANETVEQTQKKKPYQPYLVVTSRGYWGKGETALEAARNANADSKWFSASIWKANPLITDGELECGNMGSVSWYWQETTPKELRGALSDALRVGVGKIRIAKDELYLQSIIE